MSSPTAELRLKSGLTDSQIARVLGVTIRVHAGWAFDAVPSPEVLERIAAITERVNALSGTTADDRRSQLLNSSNGPSIFRQLLQEVPQLATMRTPAYTVAEMLDA